MRISAFCTAVLAYVVIGHAPPAAAQVDQQRAQEYFKEAQALCERDGGRLWGVSICAPMVIGDARTQTFATSQPPPDASRPRLIGLVNGPIQWGDRTWAAVSWDTIANWPARTRGELLLHESFHIVQPQLVPNGPAGANEHLDAVDGRYWLRLEWRALARALRERGDLRTQAVRDALAFRQARHTRYPDKVESERVLYILEGLASYTQTVLVAPSQTDAIARGLELLAGAEDGESFVRTFTYNSGPAYGLLLDAASPGWPRTVRGSDDPPAMLMRALGVQPVADAAAAAARYGGAELRAAEEQREQQRQARIAGLRQRFVARPGIRDAVRRRGPFEFDGCRGHSRCRDRVLQCLSPVGTLRHAHGGERRARGDRWRLAASAGACARRRRDDLRRRVDIQGRGGLGSARRCAQGRLRSRAPAAVSVS